MSLVDELKKLQELQQTGALSDREFADAKEALIASGGDTSQRLQVQLQQIALQNELAALDRRWIIDRERFMMTFGSRSPTIPSRWMGAFTSIIAAGFGSVWIGLAIARGAPIFFPIFGIVVVALGVIMGLYAFNKAVEHDAAFQEYQQRRAEIIRRFRHS
jgi:hypothetical protein